MDIMIPLTIKIIRDRHSKDASYMAYSPEVDIASCGPTEEKARTNLQEAVGIVLEEVEKKGSMDVFLKELGFERQKHRWIPPRISFEQFFFSLPR